MEWVCLVKMARYIGLYFAFVGLEFHQLVSVHINAKIKKNEITINANWKKELVQYTSHLDLTFGR